MRTLATAFLTIEKSDIEIQRGLRAARDAEKQKIRDEKESRWVLMKLEDDQRIWPDPQFSPRRSTKKWNW